MTAAERAAILAGRKALSVLAHRYDVGAVGGLGDILLALGLDRGATSLDVQRVYGEAAFGLNTLLEQPLDHEPSDAPDPTPPVAPARTDRAGVDLVCPSCGAGFVRVPSHP